MISSMEKYTRVYLVRHGQVVGYNGYHANGHTDVDITEVGRLQMEHLAERLRLVEISAIYVSDLKRALIGARIISRHHDVQLDVMPDLRELFFGDWEGMSLSKIRKEYPEELEKREANMADYRAPGNGESLRDLSTRVMPCLERILADQKGKGVLVVAHAAVNRVILSNALGLDIVNSFNLQQDYGCLNIIDYFPDSSLVRMING